MNALGCTGLRTSNTKAVLKYEQKYADATLGDMEKEFAEITTEIDELRAKYENKNLPNAAEKKFEKLEQQRIALGEAMKHKGGEPGSSSPSKRKLAQVEMEGAEEERLQKKVKTAKDEAEAEIKEDSKVKVESTSKKSKKIKKLESDDEEHMTAPEWKAEGSDEDVKPPKRDRATHKNIKKEQRDVKEESDEHKVKAESVEQSSRQPRGAKRKVTQEDSKGDADALRQGQQKPRIKNEQREDSDEPKKIVKSRSRKTGVKAENFTDEAQVKSEDVVPSSKPETSAEKSEAPAATTVTKRGIASRTKAPASANAKSARKAKRELPEAENQSDGSDNDDADKQQIQRGEKQEEEEQDQPPLPKKKSSKHAVGNDAKDPDASTIGRRSTRTTRSRKASKA